MFQISLLSRREETQRNNVCPDHDILRNIPTTITTNQFKLITMDELLALMNDDSIDDSSFSVDRDGGNDSSTEGEQRPRTKPINSADSRRKLDQNTRIVDREASRKESNNTVSSSSNQDRSENLVKAPVDDRLDIRMTNRLVSSNDLMDLITDYEYKSPSQLSAMTLKCLNALLQDPSPILDPATVAGKTDSLVTVGIVFSNTGTRISSKGGAFCVLTIGNLNSGPCLSIFLFGEAYGKYCISCKQGKVIALMAPKLLPSNRGDAGGSKRGPDADRTVSFSVYDAGQLKIVGNARDYGICKNPGCKNHVDKRTSEFCDFHRRQKLKGSKHTQNKFQQVQGAHRQANAILVDSTARKRNILGTGSSLKSNRYLNKTAAAKTQVASTAKQTKMASAKAPTSSNRFRDANVPKNMSKVPDRKSNMGQSISSGSSSTTTNPYLKTNVPKNMSKLPDRKTPPGVSSAKRAVELVGNNGITKNGTKKPKKSLVSGNWLEEGKAMSKERGPKNTSSGRTGFSLSHFTKSKQRSAKPNSNTPSTTNGNKSRSITTDGKGFDGSVIVPKPSALFKTPSASSEVSRRIVTPKNDPAVMEELLQTQAEVSRQMKEGRGTIREENVEKPIFTKNRLTASNARKQSSSKGPSREKSKEVNAFLAAMGGDIDTEKVRNAKSKFANEVDADEYAKQRRKVDELEKAEASHDSRNKKKNSEKKRITKTWFCKTCGKNYFKTPKACIRSSHEVDRKVDIKDDVTKEERRTELNKRSVEDGGLRVGQGIDWSTFGSR